MNDNNKAKIRILIKSYLKYIRPDGATANEIAKFISHDDWGLKHIKITAPVIRKILEDTQSNNVFTYKHITKNRKYKSGAAYVYRWIE